MTVSAIIAAREPEGAEHEVIIQQAHGWMNLHEVWEYREFYFSTWRDIKVRYKQKMIGAAWAIIQPFYTIVVSSSGTCAATLPSTAEPAARAGAAP